MTNKRLRAWLAATFAVVAVVVIVDSTGLVSDDTAVIVDDAAQLGAGLFATGACWWTSRRTAGPERSWRRLMALGMGGWSIGMAFWAYYQIFSDTPLPSPSVADVGFLTLPVFAVPALLALAVQPSRYAADGSRHGRIVFVLDGLVVVGSLFILTWATSLGAVVRSMAPTHRRLRRGRRLPHHRPGARGHRGAAGRHPAGARAAPRPALVAGVGPGRHLAVRQHLRLPGQCGRRVASAAHQRRLHRRPAAHRRGRPDDSRRPPRPCRRRPHPAVERAHLLLPYGLVALTGGVIAVQNAVGSHIDLVEATLAWVVITVVWSAR